MYMGRSMMQLEADKWQLLNRVQSRTNENIRSYEKNK